MTKTLYLGNLSYRTADADLEQLVGQYTEVQSARVATERETGRSRGFGFVEVPAEVADAVISALHGTTFDGRVLTVNEARPRVPRVDAGRSRDHRSGRGSDRQGGHGVGGGRLV